MTNKEIISDILSALEEHPTSLKQLIEAAQRADLGARGPIKSFARSLAKRGYVPIALQIAALSGAVETFGFFGLLYMLYQNLMKEKNKNAAGAKTEKEAV